MQPVFESARSDLQKGHCIKRKDNRTHPHGVRLDHLEAQLQRLEQFLVYADDSKRELATVNLLVQRNI